MRPASTPNNLQGDSYYSSKRKGHLFRKDPDKLELALRSGLPLQACFDGSGNIFQISLQNLNSF